MRKRRLVWVVIATMLTGMLSGMNLTVCVATNTEAGVLRWDFESLQDVAYVEYTTDSSLQNADTFPSGAWNNPTTNAKSMRTLTPYRVKFEDIGRSIDGIVRDTDDYTDASCGGANQTPGGVSLADGGSYCAVVSNVESSEQPEILGMAIQLRKDQVISGKNYQLEFDILSSLYYNAGGEPIDLRRMVWAGFGRPSERIGDYTELPRWLSTATRAYVDTSEEEENDNLTRGSKWLHVSCVVKAEEIQFEHGATAFYIGINNPGNPLCPAEKVYFDNITLTLVEEPEFLIKTSYGRLWDMEHDVNDWKPYVGMRVEKQKLEEAKKTNSQPATGSDSCLAAWGTATEAGVKAVLDEQVHIAGQYQLSFYAASNSSDIDFFAGINGAETKVGDGGSYWGYYSLPVTLEESAFSGGKVTLDICAKSKSGATVENLYLDDICLRYAGTDASIEKGKQLAFFAEGQKPADLSAMIITALYNAGNLLDVKLKKYSTETILFAKDCSMVIPSDANEPEIKMFCWNTSNIELLTDCYQAGVPYTQHPAQADYPWQGAWNQDKTELEFTFEDTASANGAAWYAAEVYGSDGVLLESAYGQKSVKVGCPPEAGAGIKLMRYDQSKKTAELIGVYSPAELNEMVINAVPAVSHQNLNLRGSFETGNLERWWLYRGAIYECTDETPAHTGKYVLKVEHREDNATTLQCKINEDELDPSMVLQVSCWVKKLPEDAVLKICIQQNVPGTNGNNWKYHNWVTIRDNEWHELTATIDLSQYTLKKGGVIDLWVSTGDQVATGFYADDFVISGDKPGEFWDEMIETDEKRDPELSDTPHAISGFYKPIQEDIPALKDVYKDYFKIGAAGWSSSIYEEEDERFAQLFLKHFNSYVDNGAFKANDLLKKTKRNRTEYDFTPADRVMDFASRNGIEVVGHTLVWIKPDMDYERLTKEDGTFLTRDEALSFMKEMITKIMKHYEGDGDPSEYAEGINYEDWHIAMWDVVNEAVLTDGTIRSYLGRSSWYNSIGEEYINYAYKYADEVCETNGYDIGLRYNDYSEQDQPQIDGTYQLIKNLLADGCRVDNVGMQCHFYADYDTALLRDYVEKIASLGVCIDGTELDFCAYTEAELTKKIGLFDKGITKERELTQANLVFETMQIFKEYHEIVDRVVFWTFYDGVSWMNTRTFNHVDYGGLFDYEYQAKPLYWAVADPEYFQQYYQSGKYLDSNAH